MRTMNYNDVAEQYFRAQKHFYDVVLDDSRVRLFTLLGEVTGKTVLDIGCGYGFDMRRLIRGLKKGYVMLVLFFMAVLRHLALMPAWLCWT